VPTVLLAAGNLFFASDTTHLKGTAVSEAAAQEQLEADTLATILRKLELVAACPGGADARHGAEKLGALAQASGVALLGRDGQAASTLLRRGDVTLGVLGVSEAPGSDPIVQARRLASELRSKGAQIVIALVTAEARIARRLASSVQELDFVLHGGLNRPGMSPPQRAGKATLLRAAHHGHGLLVLDLFRTGAGAFTDASTWTRNEHERALAQRSAELAAKIAEWEKDPKTDEAALDEQRARLAALRKEEAALDEAPPPAGNRFDARFFELDPEQPSDPEIRAVLDAHDRRLNDHNRTALAHLKAPSAPKGAPVYAGSERCGECHESALLWWKGHEHGRAYATLEKVHKQFSLSCVGCHVTGYNQPGGSSVVHNEKLKDVGCESCHGPGSLHAEDQDVDESKNVRRDTPESTCVQCHNPEHSDKFVYADYKQKLIVPGHGMPERAPQ
jgi:hypothetical protein